EAGRVAHLYGGEAGLLAAARELAERMGHMVRLALADDWQAACALAEGHGPDRLVPVGGSAEALAELPLDCLHPSEVIAHGLRAVGVRRVGELAALDAGAVVARFGEAGRRLHRVARGGVGEVRVPLAPEREPVARHVVLGHATDRLEPILFLLPG